MKYVIIGNSAAAVGAVEAIRRLDSVGSITLISDEPHHTYSRPLISYLLYGKTDRERMKYRPNDFYAANRVNAFLGKKVVQIRPVQSEVLTGDGAVFPYDRLLVATGSRPLIPPISGLDTVKNKFTFQSVDDAIAIGKRLTSDTKTLIIGAGLIGLKAAEGVLDRAKSVTVVDLADRVLPSILDEDGSEMVQRHLEKKGVRFILNHSVDSFSKNRAILKDGSTLPFDLLIIAVGVCPNVELMREICAKIGRGILTDRRQETSIPKIYAAGDCTESYDLSTESSRILALLPNAYMQGETAGTNMAGANAVYEDAIPMNAIGFFGLHILTAGVCQGETYVAKTEAAYKKLCVKNGVLCGFIMIGDVRNAGIYTSMIRERIPLAEVDFEKIRERPQLLAFSPARRKHSLSEAH